MLVVMTIYQLQASACLRCGQACVRALCRVSANIICTGSSPRLADNATPANLHRKGYMVTRFEVEYDRLCRGANIDIGRHVALKYSRHDSTSAATSPVVVPSRPGC